VAKQRYKEIERRKVMALRQLMLAKQIADKEKELEEIRGKDADFETREKELETSIEEANTEEERSVVDEEITKFTEEKEAHEERKSELETELGELRGKMKEYEKAPEKREKEKDMGKRSEEIEEARSAINAFVKSKGQVREGGFKEADAGILIPVEILAPQEKPEDIVDLKNYVKNVSVNSASGKYPVIAKSGSKMSTVAELEQNPELSKPKISNIDYSIETRRGYIPISQEAIDDADYDVTGLIRDEINDQSRNARNTDIATILKSATAKSVTGLDGLKDLVNKEIKKVYPVKFIISASLYAELDKLKDKNGRYLLQDSITSSSGKMLFGKEVIVLDDEMIAGDGELKGFVGDPKSFCAFFDRKQTSVEWVDNQIYGKLLAGIVRYDVKKTDTDAGFYITYTPGE
jgi:HK97 family phage major capsid protein